MVDDLAIQIPVAGVCGGGLLMAPEGRLGIQCPPPCSSSVSVATYRRVFVGLGSPPVRSDSILRVVQGKGLGAHLAGNDGGYLEL